MKFVLSAVCAALLAVPAAQAQTVRFDTSYLRYSDWSDRCDKSAGVYGREPASGTHPVLIYTHGAWGLHAGAEASKLVDVAAERGFVAASADWASFRLWYQDQLWPGNARCIYGGGGLLPKLCARPAADCSKGVVVAGFSKGAQIAARARDYSARAAYLMGYAFDTVGSTGGPTSASSMVGPRTPADRH